MSNEGLFTLLVGGLVGLFQIFPALLGNVGLLESFSEVRYRHILVLALAFEVLLHSTRHLQQTVAMQPALEDCRQHTQVNLLAQN